MFEFWSRLFRFMWKVNSGVSTTRSIMNGTYPKRMARKAAYKSFNKLFK